MVFERKHIRVSGDNSVGSVSGVINNYNNTNASGYINKIRFNRLKSNFYSNSDMVCHNDPPPEENT